MSGSFLRLWGSPIVLRICTIVGLLSALLGDGMWDTVSAVALGIPVAACAWYGWKR